MCKRLLKNMKRNQRVEHYISHIDNALIRHEAGWVSRDSFSKMRLGDEKPVGLKFDSEKPMTDLLINDMPRALEAVSQVLTFGAEKYSPGNWQYVDNAENRYKAAAFRHELAIAKGEQHDPETGIHHLAHAACCMLFRLELALREKGQ